MQAEKLQGVAGPPQCVAPPFCTLLPCMCELPVLTSEWWQGRSRAFSASEQLSFPALISEKLGQALELQKMTSRGQHKLGKSRLTVGIGLSWLPRQRRDTKLSGWCLARFQGLRNRRHIELGNMICPDAPPPPITLSDTYMG